MAALGAGPGLPAGQVQVTDEALKMIIEGYTREACVRKLY